MADAAAVFAGITRRPGTRYTALVPNLEGLDRALAARKADEVAIFAAASGDRSSKRNINQTIGESLATYAAVCDAARDAAWQAAHSRLRLDGIRLRPFEGEVSPAAAVADVSARARRHGRLRGR